jgi:hypothetical protein
MSKSEKPSSLRTKFTSAQQRAAEIESIPLPVLGRQATEFAKKFAEQNRPWQDLKETSSLNLLERRETDSRKIWEDFEKSAHEQLMSEKEDDFKEILERPRKQEMRRIQERAALRVEETKARNSLGSEANEELKEIVFAQQQDLKRRNLLTEASSEAQRIALEEVSLRVNLKDAAHEDKKRITTQARERTALKACESLTRGSFCGDEDEKRQRIIEIESIERERSLTKARGERFETKKTTLRAGDLQIPVDLATRPLGITSPTRIGNTSSAQPLSPSQRGGGREGSSA